MTRLLPITSALIASLFAAGALGLIANLPAEAAALSTPMMGYAWADQPTNPSYTPNLFYQRNTSGLQNTIARPALGVYNVRFPRLGVAGGTVDVSTYGFSTDNCQVGFWFRAGSDEVVNVRCFTVTGVPADSRFTVAFIAVPGADALDYVFANQPSNPSYTPTPIFQYNHNGSPNTVTRSGLGAYHVRLPSDGGQQGDVQVSVVGGVPGTCSVVKFGTFTPDQDVDVQCFAVGGAPADTPFLLTYANHTDLSGNHGLPFGYAWDTQPTFAVFNPPFPFGFSNGVPAGPITRLGVGHWQVRLPLTGSSFLGGDVQVSPGNADRADRCQVQSWTAGLTGSTTSIFIACENAVGAPIDAPFVVSLLH